MSKEIAEALVGVFTSDRIEGFDPDNANVVDVMARIAQELSIGLSKLGLNDASTRMGAIELLSLSVKEGCSDIAQGIFNGLELVAQAIENRARGVDD